MRGDTQMKAKDASGLKKVLIGLAAIGTAAGAKAAVTIHLLPEQKECNTTEADK